MTIDHHLPTFHHHHLHTHQTSSRHVTLNFFPQWILVLSTSMSFVDMTLRSPLSSTPHLMWSSIAIFMEPGPRPGSKVPCSSSNANHLRSMASLCSIVRGLITCHRVSCQAGKSISMKASSSGGTKVQPVTQMMVCFSPFNCLRCLSICPYFCLLQVFPSLGICQSPCVHCVEYQDNGHIAMLVI